MNEAAVAGSIAKGAWVTPEIGLSVKVAVVLSPTYCLVARLVGGLVVNAGVSRTSVPATSVPVGRSVMNRVVDPSYAAVRVCETTGPVKSDVAGSRARGAWVTPEIGFGVKIPDVVSPTYCLVAILVGGLVVKAGVSNTAVPKTSVPVGRSVINRVVDPPYAAVKVCEMTGPVKSDVAGSRAMGA